MRNVCFCLVLVLVFCLTARAQQSEPGELSQLAASYMSKGNALLGEKRYEEALRFFESAQILLPEASGPYAGLGFSQKALGLCEEAVKNFEIYLRRAPEGVLAKEVLASIKSCEDQRARLRLLMTKDTKVTILQEGRVVSMGTNLPELSLPAGSYLVLWSKEKDKNIIFSRAITLRPREQLSLALRPSARLIRASLSGSFLSNTTASLSAGLSAVILQGARQQLGLGLYGTFLSNSTTRLSIGSSYDVRIQSPLRLGLFADAGVLNSTENIFSARVGAQLLFQRNPDWALQLRPSALFWRQGQPLLLEWFSLGFERSF